MAGAYRLTLGDRSCNMREVSCNELLWTYSVLSKAQNKTVPLEDRSCQMLSFSRGKGPQMVLGWRDVPLPGPGGRTAGSRRPTPGASRR